MMNYIIILITCVLVNDLYAQEPKQRCPRHESYTESLKEKKAANPFDEIEHFTTEDAIEQDEHGKTVAMDLLSKGMYGRLSPVLNRAICHLVHLTPVESFFNIVDHQQQSLFFYIARNSELTEDTIKVIMHKVLYEDGGMDIKRKKSKKYISLMTNILQAHHEQFDEKTVRFLRCHGAFSVPDKHCILF